jgi:glycosyltransferase involved in cell wall biosynthesis
MESKNKSRSGVVRGYKQAPQTYRILQVIPQLKEGGVEESTLAMADFIDKFRHQQLGYLWRAHVAAAKGQQLPALLKTGATFHALPRNQKNPLVGVWMTLHLIKIIQTEQIALVHARSRASAWPARVAAWWCGVPFVTTFHGIYSAHGGFLKLFYNSVMVAGRLVIANSQFTAAHLAKTYHVAPEKIIVAPRGVDIQRFDPALRTPQQVSQIRQELRIQRGVPLLLMVGRLTSWKGQHLLLEAMSLLPHRRFVVAFVGGPQGRGVYAHDLVGFAHRLGVSKQVRWLGSRQDIPQLLAASTLAFSCSTRPEAFGRVAIEAQAMGVPVIASAHGGSVETIIPGKTGWLLPVNDRGEVAPQALAECIEDALRNPARLARMGLKAAQRVRGLYTQDRMCRLEVSAYLRALGLEVAKA